jgi:hypothetical protein
MLWIRGSNGPDQPDTEINNALGEETEGFECSVCGVGSSPR